MAQRKNQHLDEHFIVTSKNIVLSNRLQFIDSTKGYSLLSTRAMSKSIGNMSGKRSRPYNSLGCPADPMPVGPLHYCMGRRDKVSCYMPASNSFEILDNVLYREITTGEIDYGYYSQPYKSPIQTITGHVEICNVLVRDDPSDTAFTDDDAVVFRWTDRKVAVKVHSCATIDNLKRLNHAEDALKETASMQLIGEDREHLMGCTDVLFDGQNLNVVMQCCDSGDLFELMCNLNVMNEFQENAPPGLPEAQAKYWFRQVVSGLKSLNHDCGICHK